MGPRPGARDRRLPRGAPARPAGLPPPRAARALGALRGRRPIASSATVGALPSVAFTANLKRHVECPSLEVEGTTVGEALERVFAASPRLRGYVVDERGVLRKHMAIFVDGQLIRDRERLSDPVSPRSEIYVMQALSGG